MYAMKEMSKVKAFMKKSLGSILLEKQILTRLHHPLIANLNFSFQDNEYLFLVLDYLSGGDMRYYMNKKIHFNENQIKFFISNILLSLKYIHNNNVLHRDIKPENLVFDEKGYLHITDFGISKNLKNDKNIYDKSGTPGYISPEVLLHKPQGPTSDFFSVGIICYELIFHKKPFKGKNKKEIAEKILTKEINVTKNDLPENFNINVCDFINKLLKRNDKNRLGYNGINELIQHSWFENDIEWNMIESKLCLNVPFIPSKGDNFDSDIADKKDNIVTVHYNEYLKKINDGNYFNSFYYNYFAVQKNKSFNTKTTNYFDHKTTASTRLLRNSKSDYFLNDTLANKNSYSEYNDENNKKVNNSEMQLYDISICNKGKYFTKAHSSEIKENYNCNNFEYY